MKFPYLKLPSRDPKLKWTARPYIPIMLSGPKGDKEIFSGIEGGNLKAKLHKVKIKIVGMSEEVEILAGFIDSKGVVAILGQDGFFDSFRIKFEKDHGMVEITQIRKT